MVEESEEMQQWKVLTGKAIQLYTGKQVNEVAKIQTLFLNVSTLMPASSAAASKSACSESLNLLCLCTDTVDHKCYKVFICCLRFLVIFKQKYKRLHLQYYGALITCCCPSVCLSNCPIRLVTQEWQIAESTKLLEIFLLAHTTGSDILGEKVKFT